MIRTKDDYLFYLKADQIALKMELKHPRFFQDEIWKFQRLLRKVEFLENSKKNPISKLYSLYSRYNLEKLSKKLGYTIPPNCFGPGLSIAHRGTIVIHHGVKVGENCRIHQGVTIGSDLVNNEVPSLGNNIAISPGVVIVGAISIADGIAIGANSFVNKSFDEPNITIAGCPARKISNKSSEDRWIRATEILRSRARAGT
jgi:serine O-acetyltransferase